ncbi:MAG: OadG family protein [Candidatus Cloacimonetes bacterium]|nr:OadG family protein [Candidatus Cloacimonadota bacterium]
MNKTYGFCMLLFMLPFLLVGQQAEADDTAALIDSLSESREQSILAEYGFRDTNTLSQVAQKLEIKNIDSWKSALGLEPANKALNDMTLRRLEISPYRALLGKQTVEYGYNELSTVSEISASLSMPMKKLKAMLGNKDPLDKSWDNRSIQALNISPQRIKDIHDEFTQDVLIYGASVTLVGMLVVFSALLLTSIVIRQLVHLNRAEQSTPVIKLGSEGKLKAAPKNLSRNVIVAAITALHIHQQEIEDKRRMVLTFRRTPTNQWRASAVLSMPNRELNSRR